MCCVMHRTTPIILPQWWQTLQTPKKLARANLGEIAVFGIGFLCLGASAGLLTGFLASRARGLATNSAFSVIVLLPVLASGAAVFLVPQLATAPLNGFYPIGLLLSFLGLQAGPLVMSVEGKSTYLQVITGCYTVATAVLLGLAISAACNPDLIGIS